MASLLNKAVKNSNAFGGPTSSVDDEEENGNSVDPALSSGWASHTFWTLLLVGMDAIFYGLIVPLIGIYVGGNFVTFTDLYGPMWETIVVVVVVFLILSIFLKGGQEAYFWKHFLSGQTEFKRILLIRDAYNTVTIGYLTYQLLGVIQRIIRDRGMISHNLHEGVLYAALTPFLDDETLEKRLNILPSYHENYLNPMLEDWTMIPEHFEDTPWLLRILYNFWGMCFSAFDPSQPNESEIQHLMHVRSKAIRGAELLLTVAQLTAAVTKLMYFTSLYNYERAMNIFLSMQRDGEFDDELENDDNSEDIETKDLSAKNQTTKTENVTADGASASYKPLVKAYQGPAITKLPARGRP